MVYYMWHLLKLRWGTRVARFDFLLYGAMIAGTILNRGTPGTFIYFQF
jgi:hypothetical protein